ncbi:YbjQ family protein [Candidatus Aerophobetes bacterium]|nr:YbjQ family protein [Candidatus Aerophobetes bacterium]
MIIVNTDKIAGKKIVRTLGLVRGNTIRVRHLGRDIMASLKHIVGGEIKSYTQMMSDAREEAIARMVKQAEELSADAVTNVRFATSMIMQGAAEILCYGTAVKIEAE